MNRSTAMKKRRASNVLINQSLLRERIAAGGHHTRILDNLDELIKLLKSVQKKSGLSREEQAAHLAKLGTIKTIIDTRFRLLAKYLPDLRSLEFKQEDGSNPFAAAAKAWAEALNKKPD
jgi:hypothetical protein